MLLEKLQEHKNFTAHEKDVAEYILSHLDQISELSVGELAKASYTSKATVVRLSQKLGLNGFQDLKITLTAEINQKKRIDQLLANEPVTAESTYDDIVKTLPALYDKAVTNTRLSLDKNSMKRISQVLQKAECIDIYGTGISYILAQSAAFKISTLGLECSAYENFLAAVYPRNSGKKVNNASPAALIIIYPPQSAEYNPSVTNNVFRPFSIPQAAMIPKIG